MTRSRIKAGAFVLEGLNSISATFYFYFIYWFLKAEFGFGSRENLLWAVGHGVVYVVASIQGGRFGQRHGYLPAIRIGFAGMSIAFLLAWAVNVNAANLTRNLEIAVQAGLMVVATVSICFTWPSLEALVSEGEPGPRLQRYIGIYNLIWSGAGAVAFFLGGALIEGLGLRTVIFLIPGVMIGGQWVLATWLAGQAKAGAAQEAGHGPLASEEERHRSSVSPKAFLRMSWLANPCAYVAISTAVPLIPTLADRLGLDARAAGFFCSIWLFVRTATFVALWQWSGWHYRFRWLAGAFLGMILGFLFIFLGASMTELGAVGVLVLVTVAQVIFGICIGLIYYSSLFYSMDVGDTKGDHGGIHEAAIGVGILGGPLVGGAAQWYRPGSSSAAAWAVSGVLLMGFGALWSLWRKGKAEAGRSDGPPL